MDSIKNMLKNEKTAKTAVLVFLLRDFKNKKTSATVPVMNNARYTPIKTDPFISPSFSWKKISGIRKMLYDSPDPPCISRIPTSER